MILCTSNLINTKNHTELGKNYKSEYLPETDAEKRVRDPGVPTLKIETGVLRVFVQFSVLLPRTKRLP